MAVKKPLANYAGKVKELQSGDVISGGYYSGGTDVPVTDGGTGSSTAAAARIALGIPRTLFYSTTDVTTAGTTEETFYTITIAAATLTTNGDRVLVKFTGYSENNANSKKWLVGVAGSTRLTTTQTVNLRTGWEINVRLKRKSNTELNVSTSLIASGSGATAMYVKTEGITGLNLTTTAYDIVLKVTTSASAADVTSDGYEVEYFPFTG